MRVPYYLFAILWAVANLTISIVSITQPRWVQFHTPKSSPLQYQVRWGLFERCRTTTSNLFDPGHRSTTLWECRNFPRRDQDCLSTFSFDTTTTNNSSTIDTYSNEGNDNDGYDPDRFGFCESWLTAGYSAELSIVFGSAAVLSLIVVMFGGRKKRERGWVLCAALVGLHAISLLATTSFVAFLFNHDDRFWMGSRLGLSFIFASVSWAADVLLVIALIVGGITSRKHHKLHRRRSRSTRSSYQSIPHSTATISTVSD